MYVLSNPIHTTLITYFHTECNDEDVRLGAETYGTTDDGYDFVGGRVEACQNGKYGAFCDIGWNEIAAQGACDRLGYTDRGIVSVCHQIQPYIVSLWFKYI